MPREIFVILNESLYFICHSERAFGRGRIPGGIVRKWLIGLGKSAIIMIRPIGRQVSSLRSEWQGGGVFFFGNPNNVSPETISHISILTSQFYHYAGFFAMLRMTGRGCFFFILHGLLGEEESPQWVRVLGVVKMYLMFICDSPHECAGFFAMLRMTFQGRFLSFWTSHFPLFVILNELLGEEESLAELCEND
jgi:hypothetical protein